MTHPARRETVFSPHMGFLVKNSVREGQISESWQGGRDPMSDCWRIVVGRMWLSFPERWLFPRKGSSGDETVCLWFELGGVSCRLAVSVEKRRPDVIFATCVSCSPTPIIWSALVIWVTFVSRAWPWVCCICNFQYKEKLHKEFLGLQSNKVRGEGKCPGKLKKIHCHLSFESKWWPFMNHPLWAHCLVHLPERQSQLRRSVQISVQAWKTCMDRRTGQLKLVLKLSSGPEYEK